MLSNNLGETIERQPGAPIEADQLFVDKLTNVKKFDVRQSNALLEGITGGAWANLYIVSDATRDTEVVGHKKNKRVAVPLFLVQEESNCCIRCLCDGGQPLLAKFYHADPVVNAGKTVCGCCYTGDQYKVDAAQGVAMTMERDGCCCGKCLGCFVCTNYCQDEAYFHTGEANLKPGQTKHGDAGYFAKSEVPIGGGGFTPTFHMYSRTSDGKAYNSDSNTDANPFSKMEGPCCFGGWLSVCFDTYFDVSKFDAPKRSGDLGYVKKRSPKTCGQVCEEMVTPADRYDVEFTDSYGDLTLEQKAAILGSAIHTDFSLFEHDAPPVYIDSNDNNSYLVCTFCNVYCYGCLLPVQLYIPLNGGDN